MAFILLPATVDFASSGSAASTFGQGSRRLSRGGWTVLASAPTRVHPHAQTEHTDPDLWVVVEGYAYAAGGGACAPEVIAQLYRERGLRGLQDLGGSHTICLVDHERDAVLIGRDRLGGRNAFCNGSSGRPAMASRADLVASVAGVDDAEDEACLATLYARGAPPMDGSTPFRGVRQLLPGEWLQRFADGSLRRKRRSLAMPDRWRYGDDRGWIEDFEARFRAAVDYALPPDTGTAVMLSGGLDSPPLAALASQGLGARDHGQPRTISWLLPQHPASDESHWISLVNEALGLFPAHVDGDSYPAFSWLDPGAISADMPLYNPFRALINQCYRRAAELGCGVVFNGNAGDTLYPHYRYLLADMLMRGEWRQAMRELGRRTATRALGRLRSDAALRYAIRHYFPFLARRGARPMPGWLSAAARRSASEPAVWPPEARDHPIPELARQLLGPAMTFGRAEENVFPARFGIERRDPFQDPGLVNWSLAAPVSLSHRHGRNKWVMREIMRDVLPDAVVNKKRTGLLHAFYASGFRANRSRIRELLMDQRRIWRKYFEEDPVCAALSREEVDQEDTLAVCHAIGYTLWHLHWSERA